MRNSVFILLVPVILWLGTDVVAQKFADKSYYLIDSLDLTKLSKPDLLILDSCLNVYHEEKSDSNKLKAIGYITENMMHDSWTKYNHWMKRNVEEKIRHVSNNQEKHFYRIKLSESLNNLGYEKMNNGDLIIALDYYRQALQIKKELGSESGMATAYNNIGMIFYYQGNTIEALNYWHKSLEIREKLNDLDGMSNSYNNLGGVYERQKEYDKALEYYHNGLEIQRKLGNRSFEATSLVNIGHTYFNMEDRKKAKQYWFASLRIQEEIGDKQGMAISLNNIAKVYRAEWDLDNARSYYEQSLKCSEEIGDKYWEVYALQGLGNIHMYFGNYKEAEVFAERAWRLANIVKSPLPLSSSSIVLSNVLKMRAARTKNATERKQLMYRSDSLYNLHVALEDSISSQAQSKELYKVELKHDYEKQKALDQKENEKKIAIEKEVEKNQRIVIFSISVVLVLILIFVIFIYNRLKITRRQKRLISLQKRMVDEAYEELNQTNEEIMAQRDQIERQKAVLEVKNNELYNKNVQIFDSINYAKRLQKAILTNEKQVKAFFPDSFIFFRPKDIVSGDFYWVGQKRKQVFFAVADCTGHGVPGALMSLVCNRILTNALNDSKMEDPGLLLGYAHTKIVNEIAQEMDGYMIRDGMDISLIAFNPEKMEIKFAGAHNSMILYSKGVKTIVEADNKPVGFTYKNEKERIFTTKTVKILQDDVLYMYSDGYMDQFGGEKRQKLFYKRFEDLLTEVQVQPIPDQLKFLEAKFDAWKGEEEQIDDVTVFGVRF